MGTWTSYCSFQGSHGAHGFPGGCAKLCRGFVTSLPFAAFTFCTKHLDSGGGGGGG